MICHNQKPFSDTDAATIHDWINHPGRVLFQKFLASQVAELMALAENVRITDEYPPSDINNSKKADADAVSLQAKVLRAANKKFDEVVAKDFKFYTVELQPEPTTPTT